MMMAVAAAMMTMTIGGSFAGKVSTRWNIIAIIQPQKWTHLL